MTPVCHLGETETDQPVDDGKDAEAGTHQDDAHGFPVFSGTGFGRVGLDLGGGFGEKFFSHLDVSISVTFLVYQMSSQL